MVRTELLDIARRFADAHADASGAAPTPIPGVTLIRETMPTILQFAISRPLVAMVLQGRKRVSMGEQTFDFGAGESMLIVTDVPTISQITRASAGEPYYSIVFDLDPAVIEGLIVDMGDAPAALGQAVRIHPTEAEVADTALRLLRLLDRPALPVLQTQLIRELHYWLLTGRHGDAIRCLGMTDSHAQRIGRAVAVIRGDYAKPLRVEDLATVAGMSASSFHEHFRAITSLTPLQLQKQIRLIEARRMMLSHGAMITQAAHTVGYESVPHFTRDYGRMFGAPPARDVRAARERLQQAA